MSVVWSIIGFAILIGVLVTIHEWGHFAVARWFNVKVLQFSVGFGRPLVTWRKGETEYRLGMIPLGGYVKFLDERVEPVAEAEKPRAFNQQSVYKRFAIVLAGPMINLIFAWMVFVAINLMGVNVMKPIFERPLENSALAQALDPALHNQAWLITELNGKKVVGWQDVQQGVLQGLVHEAKFIRLELQSLSAAPTFKSIELSLDALDINDLKSVWLSQLGFVAKRPSLKPIIGEVQADSPAFQAGLQSGDVLVELDGEAVSDWHALVSRVQARPGQSIGLVYERDQARFATQVTLASVEQAGRQVGRLGASVDQTQPIDGFYHATREYGLVEAMARGTDQAWSTLTMTLTMLKKMLFGQVGLEHLSGPLSIASFSGQALQTGLVSFLALMGLLSLSLGILNLLPIPMLDGGHLMFYLWEMLRGKPVSDRVEEIGFRIGLLLVVALTVLALTNDIVRITNG